MKIIIAIPTWSGTITGEIGETLFRLARWTEEKDGIAFSLRMLGGIYPRPYARNLLVKEFFDTPEADYLWWLDADMGPNSSITNLFEALKRERSQYDIFTCYTLSLKTDDPSLMLPLVPPAFSKEIGDGSKMALELGVAEVPLAACGFGSTVLSRRVLMDQKLWATPELDFEGVPGVFADLSHPSGRCKQSEDTHFTQRATRAGYKILYVPSAVVGHYKTVNLLDINGWASNCFGEGVKRGGAGWQVAKENPNGE